MPKPTLSYNKVDGQQMEVVTSTVTETRQILSYKKILDEIQTCQERLDYLNDLKDQAEQLNLET